MTGQFSTAVVDRFFGGFIALPESGCWLWEKAWSKNGYGIFAIAKKNLIYAHRFSFAIHLGEIPVGADVCHKCDVRCCVNPAHLFSGSRLVNMRDCVAKDRQSRGDRSGRAKLADADVVAILSDQSEAEALAASYGVSAATIHSIRAGRTWRHIPRTEPSA